MNPRFGYLGSRVSELLKRAPGSAIGHGTVPRGKPSTRTIRLRCGPAFCSDAGTEEPLAITDARRIAITIAYPECASASLPVCRSAVAIRQRGEQGYCFERGL
jgi:hypothetical protein